MANRSATSASWSSGANEEKLDCKATSQEPQCNQRVQVVERQTDKGYKEILIRCLTGVPPSIADAAADRAAMESLLLSLIEVFEKDGANSLPDKMTPDDVRCAMDQYLDTLSPTEDAAQLTDRDRRQYIDYHNSLLGAKATIETLTRQLQECQHDNAEMAVRLVNHSESPRGTKANSSYVASTATKATSLSTTEETGTNSTAAVVQDDDKKRGMTELQNELANTEQRLRIVHFQLEQLKQSRLNCDQIVLFQRQLAAIAQRLQHFRRAIVATQSSGVYPESPAGDSEILEWKLKRYSANCIHTQQSSAPLHHNIN